MSRNSAASLTLAARKGCGTMKSSTSSTRDFPD
jgi:hypothetical protein